MDNLKDKVVVITGAGGGMGEATARKLNKFGAKVVLGECEEDHLQTIVDKNVIHIKADVDVLIHQALNAFGRIDVLWNNVGIMPVSFFEDGKLQEWEQVMDVKIKGVLRRIHSVIPHMLERGDGHILTTSSPIVYKTFPSTGVYAGTKFAIRAIMESLRKGLTGIIKGTTIYSEAMNPESTHPATITGVFDMFGGLNKIPHLNAEGIADAILFAISQPGNEGIYEITIRTLNMPLRPQVSN